MNWQRLTGICGKFAGGLSEAWILATSPRRADNERHRIDAKARQREELARKEAARQMRDFQHRNRHWQTLNARID